MAPKDKGKTGKDAVAEEPAATSDSAPAKEAVPIDSEKAAELASFDLTNKMTPFLDRHLIFPIYQFLQETGMYKKEGVIRAELSLLGQTNMIDFAVEKYDSIGEKAPDHLIDRRDVVMEQLTNTRDRVLPLLLIFEDPDAVARMAGCKSIAEICETFELDPAVINDLVNYAKLQYDCGNYETSGELLKHYRGNISQEAEQLMTAAFVSSTWGSLACFLLIPEFDLAIDLIFKLDEYLENSKMSKREILLQRSWLLHWTLFAIFRAQKTEGRYMDLLNYFLNEKSLSIISLSCPHLLRYVGACLILQKRLKHLVKDTVAILHHEVSSYKDPITAFLLALYTDMDFDEAQHELQRCKVVCEADFFLAPHWTEFEENARLLVFETYCRIHQCINIAMIASKLNMEAEDAELWIVKLIQNAKLDARIDSEKSRVVMSKAPPSVYQQVIEKTKNSAFRSTMLLSNLEKREKELLANKSGVSAY